jgi:dCMP deaminase
MKLIEKDVIDLILRYAANNSEDPSRQVGACIVKDGVALSLGANTAPKRYAKHMTWNRGEGLDNKHLYVVHAELNAILNAKKDLNGATLYTTLFPCNACTQAIIQVGIKEVVYLEHIFEDSVKYKASQLMLDMCGIKYRRYDEE